MTDHLGELIELMAAAIWTERGLSTETNWHDVDALTAVSTVYRNLAGAALDALKAAGYEVVKLPEPESVQGDVSNWWGGDIWCTPGSGRLRVYVQDARFRVGEALSFAANVVAAANAAEEVTDD